MRSKLKSKMLISLLLCCVGLGFVMLGKTVSPTFLYIGFVLLLGAVIVRTSICCPHCGHRLSSKRIGLPNFCPNCGKSLMDGQAEDE